MTRIELSDAGARGCPGGGSAIFNPGEMNCEWNSFDTLLVLCVVKCFVLCTWLRWRKFGRGWCLCMRFSCKAVASRMWGKFISWWHLHDNYAIDRYT
jgi:hypothetical protein